jgi:hypothetical protein
MMQNTSSETDCCLHLIKKFIALRNFKFVWICLWGSMSMDYGTGTHYINQAHVAQSPLEPEEELFSSFRELTYAS